jgi:Kef-type K+ transport system membrane component KefB
VDPGQEVIHLLAEVGVLVLLFEIGLETNLRGLLHVGGGAAAVAVTGVALPFVAGFGLALLLGAEPLFAAFMGATFTATSVAVTARVLRDLRQLDTPEARVILGAAVIDDVLGLAILLVITGILAGGELSVISALRRLAISVVVLGGSIAVGRLVIPSAMRALSGMRVRGVLVPVSISLAFSLALLADLAGSAMILGAFAAGLILAGTDQRKEIERGVRPVAHLLVPIFFVTVGAQVDLSAFDPRDRAAWPLIAEVLGLAVLAVATKWAAGHSAFWLRIRRNVVGAGMVPRGEVGLIFAQMGFATAALTPEFFGALMLMVMGTTFVTPPWLAWIAGAHREVFSVDEPDAEEQDIGTMDDLVSGEP